MSGLMRFGELVFPYLLDAVWKATALIVIVFLLVRVLGRRRLVARYWLWVYCLIGLLILPATSFVAGNHRLALLPAKEQARISARYSESSGLSPVVAENTHAREEAHHEAAPQMPPVASVVGKLPAEPPARKETDSEVSADEGPDRSPALNEGVTETQTDPILAEAVAPEPSTVSVTETTSPSETSAGAPVPATQASPPVIGSKTASPFPWRPLISVGWLAGCAVFVLRLLLAVMGVVRLRRSSSPISAPAILDLFDEAKRAAGFKTRAELRLGKRVTSPVSVGVLRPVILLPETLPREMPQEQLRPILLHELAHIRWRDCTINMIQRFIQALFFFHPFVHLLNRRLRRLREEICDYWVLNHCRSTVLYAKALTTLAERLVMPQKGLIGVGLFNHRLRLPERIKRILNSGKGLPTTIRLRTAVALLSISLLVVGALSIASLSARTAKAEGSDEAGDGAKEHVISWKDDAVYRDGKPYAKIVQWEPEADLPMIAFGDQNNNGKTDTWIRFLNGKPLRIETDSNEDGRIDKWEHYFQGVIDLVEQDTDFNRRVDLWQVYDNGKLFREEIDENADGSVDKWLEVNEKGKLAEKEIFSWVAGFPSRTTTGWGRGYPLTFFNARDRVEKIEEEVSSATPVGTSRAPAPRSAYCASSGSRIEVTKEVEGKNLVFGWHHMAASDTELSDKLREWVSTPRARKPGIRVRHSAEDRGLDGGVDSWKQLGPPRSPGPEATDEWNKVAFRVVLDDRNRDGKADHCKIELARDAAARQVSSWVTQRDSDGDGMADDCCSTWEGLQAHRRDADHDGLLETFVGQQIPWHIEALGTAALRLESKLLAGEKPAPLLCQLNIKPEEGEPKYGRAFWLVAGETVVVPKLSRGMYDLEISVMGRPGYVAPPGEAPVPGSRVSSELGRVGTMWFSYPGFVVLEKGQTVSKTLTFDTRPVFRGRLISSNVEPLAIFLVTVSLPGNLPASVEAVTDAAGDLELFNIPPGRYVLSGYNVLRVLSAPPEGFGQPPGQIIEIAPPSEQPPERELICTNVARPQGAPKIPPDWQVPVAMFGKVLSHDGEPLPNMLLEVSSVTRRKISRRAISGLDGSYSILALVPGLYSVKIYNNDFPRRETSLEDFRVQIEQTPMQKDFRLSRPLPVMIE